MNRNFVFTSESVTEGHPDKLCDQISDAIVDAYLREDRFSRVVAETALATGIGFIAVRFASRAAIDVAAIARQVIQRAGYVGDDFNAQNCSIMTSMNAMSDDDYDETDEADMSNRAIARVPASHLISVFGYACRHTPALMPLPIWLAHKIAHRIATVRLTGELDALSPDATVQVGVEFKDRVPKRIHSITVITALAPGTTLKRKALEKAVRKFVIAPAFEGEAIKPDKATNIFINPHGVFTEGGPSAHAGLTGRKMSDDLYGGFCRQSAAALSGKDPTRIDRTGVYGARWAAKTVVAAGLADECEVQLSYAVDRAEPISVQVDTFGTGRIDDAALSARVRAQFDFRPAALIRHFGLRDLPALGRHGFFTRLAAYGHVGRQDIGLPWELPDRVKALTES